VFTEPGMEILGDLPASKVKWQFIPPATPSWPTMLDNAQKINSLSTEAIAKINPPKGDYNQFIKLLTGLNKFIDARTGENYGDIVDWETDQALCIDSLSGVNIMAMDLVVGGKPIKSLPEWGIAMDNLARFIQKLCMDTTCHFVLTAHLELERDETTGSVKNMASTLGRKLAPVLPRYFSDVVMCKREGGKFIWSTEEPNADLKFRNLASSSSLPPSFAPLIENWKKRGGIVKSRLHVVH